jgi:hypothetical protein
MYALLIIAIDVVCLAVFLGMACRATNGDGKPWAG